MSAVVSSTHPVRDAWAARVRVADPPGESWSARAGRRARDLLVMGLVGPLAGAIAVGTLAAYARLHPPRARIAEPVAHVSAPARLLPAVPGAPSVAPLQPRPPRLTEADFGPVRPTRDARHMADWVVARDDNGTMPFFVIDKRDARLYVFDARGQLVDASPVLLGAARGDDSYPGIGDVPIPQVKPWQRTTPAGRFVTQPGLDDEHHDVVWIDYDAAVAMHRVIDKVRSERRPERLASPSPLDNRISFGCINVPIDFFERVVSPVFGKHRGVAYVIPEVRSFAQVFEAAAPQARTAVAQPVPAVPAGPTAVR